MNISTDFRQITPDPGKSFGGYEWWYFDGLSKEGDIGYVIIFYQSNPFSTRYVKDLEENKSGEAAYPAISVSIYKQGKTIYYSFLEFEKEEFDWDEKEKTLRVENNVIRYNETEDGVFIDLELNQVLDSGHRLKGSVKGKAHLGNENLISQNSTEKHSWNLLVPGMETEVDLHVDGLNGEEEVVFSGRGYHDHNTGYEPMKESFKDWYWGRYHFEEFTLIYYLMEKYNEQQFEAWLIDDKNQKLMEHFEEANLDYYSRNLFGLKSARKIELETPQVSVNIQCNSKIDDGPFYQRFLGNSVLRYNGQVYGAQGFSEYIYPNNIYNRWYWPLVHMRLRYKAEAPHWVQKSRSLYQWTW